MVGQDSEQKSKHQIMQRISFLITDKSRLLYLYSNLFQREFLSTSPRCWHVRSSTCNNRNEQYLELAYDTLIEK
jgi:hypothetical protein